MGKITGIKKEGNRNQNVTILIDGKPGLKVKRETVINQNLSTGQDLSDEQVKVLGNIDRQQQGLDIAVRLLGYRPRSTREIDVNLKKRGFSEDEIRSIIRVLEEKGLIDEEEFARYWTENRKTFSPRGRHLTALELRQKGISQEIVREVTEQIDERENAYRAAASRVRRLSGLDSDIFSRRLGEYLRRRGFEYEVIVETVERLRRELQENTKSC